MKNKKLPSPAVPGYRAAGIACGIKDGGKKDLALILSATPATAAGIFTRNRVQSPGVVWSKNVLRRNPCVRGVIVNSGNANACTGAQGMDACRTVTRTLAGELEIQPNELLMASTGVIGVPLPAEKIITALPRLTLSLSAKGWTPAAEAIMTTDLVMKTARVRYHQGKRPIVVGGIAKGSGMIEPDMATMLAFLFTDAAIEPRALKAALREAGGQTFNSITVDGECSTNDCAIVLANGVAGNTPIRENTPAGRAFLQALTEVCQSLAIQIVEDGEGATKLIEVLVEGAGTDRAARRVASAIANSNLVKTAVFGEDPNWGRILCAAGHAGVPFNPDRVDIAVNAMQLVKGGVPVSGVSLRALQKRMRKKSVQIRVHLHSGSHQAKIHTCDLSYDYVRINAEYTT